MSWADEDFFLLSSRRAKPRSGVQHELHLRIGILGSTALFHRRHIHCLSCRNLWISYYPTCLNSPFPFPASICLSLWAWMPSHWILLSAAISFQFSFHCPLPKTPHSFLANNYGTLQLNSQLWNDTLSIEQSPQMYSWSFWEWHGEIGLSCIWGEVIITRRNHSQPQQAQNKLVAGKTYVPCVNQIRLSQEQY